MADDILKEAMDRFQESEDGDSFNREAALDDIRFARLAEQWPDQIKKQRQQEGRPCLTINRLPAFVRQVVNDARQNKPSIKAHPVDNGADEDTAQVIDGLFRSIERGSNAEVAYDTAIEHAVTGGFGYFRIGLDYCHDQTFDLEARIERVPNPLMVYRDVNSTEFDASDWEYAFVSDFLSKERFKQLYPDAAPIDFESDQRSYAADWLLENTVRVAEYWQRVDEKKTLLQLSNGMTVLEEALPRMAKQVAEAGGLDVSGMSDDDLAANFLAYNEAQVMRSREVDSHKIIRRMISGADVLEESEWPGSLIPICPVFGEEVIVDGRRHFRSMIRDAKDPQKMFNFWRSSSTELVALAPRAPFMVEDGAIPEDEAERRKWDTANNQSHAYLTYSRGTEMPKRQPFAGVPAGNIQEALNASDDMKAIIGIYDSSLGAKSNETSGRAIMARQREADVSNFHFIDNLNRAIKYAGKVLLDIIPSVYSVRQTIRILGEDDAEKVIRLSMEGDQASYADPEDETGERKLFNLGVGKYDVTVKSGPSYATQREETREMLLEIMQRVPGAAAVIGDYVLDYMDFPQSDEIAERLRLLLPPQVQMAEGIIPPGAIPPGIAPQGVQQPGQAPGFSLPNPPQNGGGAGI
jgi:hypothetical protein